MCNWLKVPFTFFSKQLNINFLSLSADLTSTRNSIRLSFFLGGGLCVFKFYFFTITQGVLSWSPVFCLKFCLHPLLLCDLQKQTIILFVSIYLSVSSCLSLKISIFILFISIFLSIFLCIYLSMCSYLPPFIYIFFLTINLFVYLSS